MASRVETGTKTFTASGAIAQHLMVKVDSNGEIALAGASDENPIGTAAREAFADQDKIAVNLLSSQGTLIGVATAAFAVAAKLYLGANGTIDDSGTVHIGVALEAAGAAGDWVEFLPTGINTIV